MIKSTTIDSSALVLEGENPIKKKKLGFSIRNKKSKWCITDLHVRPWQGGPQFYKNDHKMPIHDIEVLHVSLDVNYHDISPFAKYRCFEL